jgi:drug/metabolite transporter (DMT)-like permease
LVFWEHVILVAIALPFVIPRLGELRRVRAATLGWLVFSGVAGSAVGAVFFSLALQHGNPTVVNVVLNIQPALSTTGAVLLFGDRLSRQFWPWAALAIVSGALLVLNFEPGAHPTIDLGVGYALVCALFWGLSTVAGRGVMTEMSLPLAAGLRVIIGLLCMTVIVAARGLLSAHTLWPDVATSRTALDLFLLATVSGAVPLVIYFKGLQLTHASTAGYFEMMQTLAATVITWAGFGAALEWYQVVGAVALIGAVAMVQRAQEQVGSA